MTTVTCTFRFPAGHRLLGHKGRCRWPHGHSYRAEVEVGRRDGKLDELGMVCDFHLLKDTVGRWVDDNWDHAFLLNSLDEQYQTLNTGEEKVYEFDERNPTAEVMAEVLLNQAALLLGPEYAVVRARVEESEGCWAEARA